MLSSKISNLEMAAAARKMIMANAYGSIESNKTMKEFFKLANTKQMQDGREVSQQGRALVAYYTELGKVKKEFKPVVIEELPDRFERNAASDPELAKIAKEFKDGLKKNYPKTLADRISLADFGCVVNDRVRPQSFWRKLMVSISHLIREEK